MGKTLRTSGDYTIQAGDGYNSGSGSNTINLDSLNVSVTGNLTVGGTSTTVNTTNTTIEDNIIELNTGASANLNSAGIIIERGSAGDNAAILWKEDTDSFIFGTTTATAADKSGAISVNAGSLEVSNLTAGSVTTNEISANGSNAAITIASSGTGDINLDSGGDLIVDVDNADLILKDDGTEFGRLSRVTADFVVKSSAQDQDLIFKGNDGGATVTPLTFDMSEGGDAIFGAKLVTNGNRITHAQSGTVSFMDFTVTQFGQDNNTVLSSVKSINMFLDSNGGDSGQAFRIFNNTNPDSSPTETTFIFKVDESGDTTIKGDLTATDITANSLTTNVISSNGSNAGISIQPSGTGDVLLGALRVNGTTVSSDDSTKITVAEDVDVIGKLRLPDGSVSDNYAAFGDAEDLKIFHNGTHSIVREVGTGNLHLQSDNEVVLSKDTDTELMVRGIADGAVELYHDNVKKLETTASGVIVGGDITAGSVTTNAISSNGSNADISIQPSGTGNVTLGAVKINGTTLSSDDSTKITIAEATDVTGTLFSRGNVFGVQRLTGSGSTEVINLTDTVTLLITTGSSQQFSLADGVEGQLKIISMVTDGGTGVVTPANFVNGTNITFDDVQDTVTLLYQSTGWVALARQNAIFG